MPLAISLGDRVDAEVRGQARSQADVVAASASELLAPARRPALENLVEISAESVRGRVIVVDSRGRLVADSAGAPQGRSYANRPEVKAALNGRGEQITRDSKTLGAEILATSAPILEHGRPAGAVRITQSVAAVHDAVRTSILDLSALGLIVLLLGLVAGALIAQQIARPIRRLDLAAQRVASGDLETTVEVRGTTEQRSLARAFNEMTHRVKRLLRSQQDFVADASHQLRTPLTGLRLRLEGLGERFHEEGPVSSELDAATREVDRLSAIVAELLILSRAGEHELPATTIDLDETARRAAERWHHTAEELDIELEIRFEAEGLSINCAGPDLDRALDSLVENALRYSPVESTVAIVVRAGGIEVLDEGPGLEPGEEEVVFERFSRGSAGRRGPSGTGLGLPIARELARQWGADVIVSNRSEGGLRAAIEVKP